MKDKYKDLIGILLRDPNKSIFEEIRKALAQGKIVFIRIKK